MNTDEKIYLIYLYCPDKVYRKCNGLDFIYNHFDYKEGIWYGLYGFTTKKKLIDEFMKIHSKKYFHIKTVDNNEPRYEILVEELRSSSYYNMKIKPHKFLTKKGNVKLVTTKFEYQLCSSNDMMDDTLQIIVNKIFTNDICRCLPEPCVFKSDIEKSLVKLGYEYTFYTYCYVPYDDGCDTNYDSFIPEGDARYETFHYNSGFNLSCNGKWKFVKPDTDQVSAFIILFGKLLDVED